MNANLYVCTYSEVDWWSLGIVCFELLTGWPPFFDRDFVKMCDKILNKPLKFPSKYNITQPAQHVIRGLLERDPSRRLGELCTSVGGSASMSATTSSRRGEPSSNGISVAPLSVNVLYNHPFFVDIHWEDVREGKLLPPYVPVTAVGTDPTDTRNFDREFTKLPLKNSVCAPCTSSTVS